MRLVHICASPPHSDQGGTMKEPLSTLTRSSQTIPVPMINDRAGRLLDLPKRPDSHLLKLPVQMEKPK